MTTRTPIGSNVHIHQSSQPFHSRGSEAAGFFGFALTTSATLPTPYIQASFTQLTEWKGWPVEHMGKDQGRKTRCKQIYHAACSQQLCRSVNIGSREMEPDDGLLSQVLSMAVNSGLVTFPTGYKRVGYAKGLTVWSPQPPQGYLALGHVATSGEEEPPTNQVCSHKCVLPPPPPPGKYV